MPEKPSRATRFLEFFASRFALRENSLWRVMKLLAPVKHWIILANIFLAIASSLQAVGYVSLVPLANATLSSNFGNSASNNTILPQQQLAQSAQKWRFMGRQMQKWQAVKARFNGWMRASLPRYVLVFSLFLLGVVLLQGVFEFFGNLILARVTIEVCSDLMRDIYANVLRQEMQFFHNSSSGYLLKICYQEVFQLRDIMMFLASDRMMLPVQMGIFFVGLLIISPYLSFLLVFLLPIVIFPTMYLNRKLKQNLDKEIDEEAETMELMNEGLQNIQAIKTFGAEKIEKAYVDPSITNYVHITGRRRAAQAMVGPVIDVLNMVVILVVFVTAIFVLSRMLSLQPSKLLVFMVVLQRFYGPFRSLMAMKFKMQRASSMARRIFRLYDREPAITEDTKAVEFPKDWRTLAAKNVHLHYDIARKNRTMRRPALLGVDFEIRRGEAIALIGPNGAGKSSIVNLICRLYDPSKGSIAVDDVPLSKIRMESLHRKICLITQHPILFNRSVADNIAFGLPRVSREAIIEAAKATGADGFVRNLPNGYETVIGEQGRMLSGGERQKIVLARAFVRKPDILILDEPTTGLDHQTTQEFLELVSSLHAIGTTVIYITHEPSHLARFDRILQLTEDKKVVEVDRAQFLPATEDDALGV